MAILYWFLLGISNKISNLRAIKAKIEKINFWGSVIKSSSPKLNLAGQNRNEKNTPLYFLFLVVSRSVPIIIFRVPFVFHASPIEDDLKVYFITDWMIVNQDRDKVRTWGEKPGNSPFLSRILPSKTGYFKFLVS